MFRLTIIVAATKSNGIGKNASLPWRLPKEMKHFTLATSTAPEGKLNAVIMGRNTWESIPMKYRPLPNRINIVTTRNKNYELEKNAHSYLHADLASALAQVDSQANSIHRAFVIGGASLYAESLALAGTSSIAIVDRILLTRILSPNFDCDVFMPDFLGEKKEGGQTWNRASHEELVTWLGFGVAEGVQEENGVKYEFQMWVRGL